MISPTIFREYDIRGIAGQDLDVGKYRLLGLGFGTYVRNAGEKTVVIGHDCRLSSPEYHAAAIEGLREAGCDVLDVGLLPTPVLYWAKIHLNAGAGAVVTASHNPGNYNGFKMGLRDTSVYGPHIQEILGIIQRQAFTEGRGSLKQVAVIDDYVKMVLAKVQLHRAFKVVVDAGNGMASELAPRLLEAMGCEVIPLYCKMDGTFPNHHPDPTVEKNLTEMIATVKRTGAEIGLGFDGDSDRIGAISAEGNIVWGDQVLAYFSREVLARKPGASVVFEVKCSQALVTDIERHGGKPVMWKAGHSLIKAKMKEVHAEIGGEMSGHIFFKDGFFGHDDALYAACRLVEILSRDTKTLSESLSDLDQYHSTPEIRIDCPDESKFQVVRELTERFRKRYDVIDVDGVRVLFPDGWGLVRASNTQGLLVLRFEAKTQENLERNREEILTELRTFPEVDVNAVH